MSKKIKENVEETLNSDVKEETVITENEVKKEASAVKKEKYSKQFIISMVLLGLLASFIFGFFGGIVGSRTMGRHDQFTIGDNRNFTRYNNFDRKGRN